MVLFEELKLKNGFRLLAVDTPGKFGALVEMFVQIGSKYENKLEAGVSHFLEHLAFKGTHNRPVALDLLKEFDSKGVSYNAGTSYESTSYYIKCLPNQLIWAGEMLSDILLNSKFDQEELEKERGVVLEEIAMYNDTPSEGLSSVFFEKFLSSNLGCWNIVGNKESLEKMDSKFIFGYRDKYFDPERCVCVVMLDFKKVENVSLILENIAKNWVNVKSSTEQLPVLSSKINTFNDIIQKDVDQAHFCLGWEGVTRNNPKKYLVRILETMMCGNFSSRLLSLLREEMGVAYYVHSIGESMSEIGVMGVQAGVKMDQVQDIVDRTKEEVLNLGSWITPQALERTKNYLVGNTLLSMDRSSFWSEFIGQRLLLDGEVPDIDSELELYKKVTLEELQEFCKLNLKADLVSSLILKR